MLNSLGQPFFALGQSGQALKAHTTELKHPLTGFLNTVGFRLIAMPFSSWQLPLKGHLDSKDYGLLHTLSPKLEDIFFDGS